MLLFYKLTLLVNYLNYLVIIARIYSIYIKIKIYFNKSFSFFLIKKNPFEMNGFLTY